LRPLFLLSEVQATPIPVASRCKASVCGRLLIGIVGSNSAGGVEGRLLWMLCFVR